MTASRLMFWCFVSLVVAGTAASTTLAGAQAPAAAPLPLAAPVKPPAPVGSPAAPAGNPLQLKFAAPNLQHGQQLAAQGCAGCHGAGGASSKEGVPGLAGQIPSYTQFQLTVFRAKLRPSPVMQKVAAKLSDQDVADLSAYFAAQPVGPAWKADATARSRGEKLFQGGDAARNVIACAVCHGAGGRGVADNDIASITNLSPKYANSVLHEFRDSPGFGGLIAPEAMRIALHPLTDQDLLDVSAYISSMK
ncbi:cytochrome c4 [Deinococcus sp.]|uniref:c-type cytochrome n=1 Tax=Deinococcus sp. TaxID=47478 RepID=UPI0025C04ECA|nr:cytochrome c4 [Deinococcus sp.]